MSFFQIEAADKFQLEEVQYMEDKKILLNNIDKIHTTEMGIDRIKKI